MRHYVALLAVALLLTDAAAQEAYKWKDDKGVWHFSQTPPAQGEKEKLQWKDKPTKLPADAPCSPFKVGETREPLAYDSDANSPVQIVTAQIKMAEGGDAYARFVWKITVRNVTDREQAFYGRVKLMDCERFLVAEDIVQRHRIGGYKEGVVDGNMITRGAMASKVGRFNIGLDMTHR